MRNLDWHGSWNARDLGGLTTTDGRSIRRGALVRSEQLRKLSPEGWDSLVAHGVRTIVDLRWREEIDRDEHVTPRGVEVRVVAMEDGLHGDEEFSDWLASGLAGTALYFAPFLQRWPERVVRALRAFATAGPGGVLVHCAKGSDRTGLIVAVLLTLAGVPAGQVADDYLLTAKRLTGPAAQSLGLTDDSEALTAVLVREGSGGSRESILNFLEFTDIEMQLRRGGLTDGDLEALRSRLVGPG